MKQWLALPGKIAVFIAIAIVTLYQWTISPLLGPACRFEPSCSRYMIGALRKYGFFVGSWQGIKRVCRCHPWHPGGYDPP